ncbi:hypothetical protein P8605_02450 [Streptomyces sp. T-3]|nr:hypothetical protein [Streptomyces sp. T-3]
MHRSNARKTLPTGIAVLVLCVGLVLGGLSVSLGWFGAAHPEGYVAVFLGLLPIAVWARIFGAIWRNRNDTIAVDATGLWVCNRVGRNVIRWDTLAGVTVYWHPTGTQPARRESLELLPAASIDRNDPVLRPLVRDEEPHQPHLPRLRYRIVLHDSARDELITAVRQQAGSLWLGEIERDRGQS